MTAANDSVNTLCTPQPPERRLVVKSNVGGPELWVTGASLRRKNLSDTREVRSLDTADSGVTNPITCFCGKTTGDSTQQICTCLLEPRHSIALGEICGPHAEEPDQQMLKAAARVSSSNHLGVDHMYKKSSIHRRIKQNKHYNIPTRGLLGNPRAVGSLVGSANNINCSRKFRASGRGGHLPRRSSVLSAMDLAVAGANLVRRISSSIHFRRPLSLSVGWMFPYR
jgi:hypothetical protein